ncbi:MAG: protoporphyrinogen oxidase [Chlamydiales bacterium]|nr:protoporphyrinogen oxidase [Chlamydiales bacterium]
MQQKKKTRVIVLGGGISGLAAAWYLSQTCECEITLIEKQPRIGGFLRTDVHDGFQFEKGPRIFKTSRSEALLRLIDELGLSSQRVVSAKDANLRYIWRGGSLQLFPKNLAGFLSSPLTRPLIASLFSEWKKPSLAGDESIHAFVCRRFGESVAKELFDPLIVGIYAGDIRKLSIKSCFSQLKKWEEEHGSVTAGFLKSRSRADAIDTFGLPRSSLFSLKGGIETLIHTLKEKIPATIVCGKKVETLRFFKDTVRVNTQEESWEADYLFSALPSYELASYLKEVEPAAATTLSEIRFQDIATVHLGFRSSVLETRGFGYLVPSHAKQEILGTVFDSNLFSNESETRLSTMLLLEGGDHEAHALAAVKNHLGIHVPCDHLSVTESKWAIPQFEVGHEARMKGLERELANSLPRLTLVGNYLGGAAVSDAVLYSRKKAVEFSRKIQKL